MEPQTRILLDKSAGSRAALDFALAPDILGFHAQQACEKLLKALLIELGVRPPHIHNLGALVNLVVANDQAMPTPSGFAWDELTHYAGRLRYDELLASEEPDPAELRACVDALRVHVEARVQALAAAKAASAAARPAGGGQSA